MYGLEDLINVSKFIFKNPEDLVVISDSKGYILYLNPKAREFFNIKDDAKIDELICSDKFNCSGLEKISKFCAVNDLTGLCEELSTTTNILINSES